MLDISRCARVLFSTLAAPSACIYFRAQAHTALTVSNPPPAQDEKHQKHVLQHVNVKDEAHEGR